MRNWIKKIITECLKETIREQPMIISHRAPCSDDVFEKGTTWKHGHDIYITKRIKADWEKQQ